MKSMPISITAIFAAAPGVIVSFFNQAKKQNGCNQACAYRVCNLRGNLIIRLECSVFSQVKTNEPY